MCFFDSGALYAPIVTNTHIGGALVHWTDKSRHRYIQSTCMPANGIIGDSGWRKVSQNQWPSSKTPQTYEATTWWRHQMATFSALLAICAGNSPASGEFPAQRPVTRSFDVFFDLCVINGCENNRKAGDLRRYRAHYDVIVMSVARVHGNAYPITLSRLCGESTGDRWFLLTKGQ